ncbi:MAG: hypothetical protein Q8P31_00060 [Bacillota bacterium]|nr:hypothetical protein [Bacillota bacterium]
MAAMSARWRMDGGGGDIGGGGAGAGGGCSGDIVHRLLASHEPSVRFKVRVGVLGESFGSPEMMALREEIRGSSRVRDLLSERGADGRLPRHAYAKWRGSHWVLATLADIGYPPGDRSLEPLREHVFDWLFSDGHWRGIRAIDGRVRRCASQEANAVYATLKLELADERTDTLAERLAGWQWPDGGWNCDKRPEAVNSSFMESLIPLRALALHARLTGSARSYEAAERAADIFLKRRMFRRQADGTVIQPSFALLHYPCYWHYDILFGLKVMAEAGFLGDERCSEALDLLESKRLLDGGFPAEGRYYRRVPPHDARYLRGSGFEPVDWGPTGRRRANEWVSADALAVLRAAGRV